MFLAKGKIYFIVDLTIFSSAREKSGPEIKIVPPNTGLHPSIVMRN